MADFGGKWMALGVGVPRSQDACKRPGGGIQPLVVRRALYRKRGGLTTVLCPGIKCMALTKSLPYIGLSFPI